MRTKPQKVVFSNDSTREDFSAFLKAYPSNKTCNFSTMSARLVNAGMKPVRGEEEDFSIQKEPVLWKPPTEGKTFTWFDRAKGKSAIIVKYCRFDHLITKDKIRKSY